MVIEKDPECRRLNKTRWPGCDVITDITRVTKGEIEKYMRSVPGLTGVIAWGRLSVSGSVKVECEPNSPSRPEVPVVLQVCGDSGLD